ncbi:helix-turn-helix domain-containing protein [Brevibacterium gallinarum]|uniref:Helix-turn-helix domain-containing protein n=1 Tax=Brevibacterium gallinarum TaxID=2762220 RepID=A0ABR8WVM9_9MICO|nr:helix-turn-helix domain-containing protein [Brevibacterium gallinarum]MBD8020992.1 helix-turn-helix domain-containing protein [Brevibacterium gallinarum]
MTSSPLPQIAAALRRERTRLGLSLSEAAKRAAVSKSTLSGLEAGVGNPSIETMWALATAYQVPLAQLLDPPAPEVSVIRFGELPQLASGSADYAAMLLSSCPPHARRDLYLITAEPGSIKHSEPHEAGTVEHVIIGSGSARATVAEATIELAAGDYLRYPGDAAHSFEALEPGTLAVFAVQTG